MPNWELTYLDAGNVTLNAWLMKEMALNAKLKNNGSKRQTVNNGFECQIEN